MWGAGFACAEASTVRSEPSFYRVLVDPSLTTRMALWVLFQLEGAASRGASLDVVDSVYSRHLGT